MALSLRRMELVTSSVVQNQETELEFASMFVRFLTKGIYDIPANAGPSVD